MKEKLAEIDQPADGEGQTQETLVSEQPQSVQDAQTEIKLFVRFQRLFEIVLIVFGLYAMYMYLPHYVLGTDAQIRFRAISDLLTYGRIPHMKYSLVGPAFSMPFWLLGKVYESSIWWCERYNLFVFAFGLLVMYFLLKDRIDRSLLHKFLLILIVASMFGNHITNYYSEVFTAICVGVGILAITIGPRLVGWSAIVLGVVNAPATLLGLCCVVFKQVYDSRRLRYILAVVAAAMLIMTEAWIRRGSPFNGGYGGEPGFGFSFIALISILFSFGKGLLFFAPGLVLPIRKSVLRMKRGIKLELYRVYLLWMCFLVGMILVYSSWWAWYGGWFWGPRFFLFASIPASFAIAVRLHYRNTSLAINLLTAVVFLLSVWVGIDGAVFDQKTLQGVCTRVGDVCLYQLQLSVLVRPFLAHSQISSYEAYFVVYSLIVALYLAIPLGATIVQQVVDLAKNYGIIFLKYKEWRF